MDLGALVVVDHGEVAKGHGLEVTDGRKGIVGTGCGIGVKHQSAALKASLDHDGHSN